MINTIYRTLNYIVSSILLLVIAISSQASCLWTSPYPNPNADLAGSWSGGTVYKGTPRMHIDITYTPPSSQNVTTCQTVRKKSGFPFFGKADYKQCTITQECIQGGFYGSDIDWLTMNQFEIANKESVGVEVEDYVRFEFVAHGVANRIWVRRESEDTISFIRDRAPFGDEYHWETLSRD